MALKFDWRPLAILALLFADKLFAMPTWLDVSLTVVSLGILLPTFLAHTTRAEQWFALVGAAVMLGMSYYIDRHPEFSVTTRRLIAVPIFAVFLLWIVGLFGGLRWFIARRASRTGA